MTHAINQTTAPAIEPVTLDQAKTHLRVDGTDQDTEITSLIAMARQRVEQETERALITQEWELTLDYWPGVIEVPLPPLQSVQSIQYLDTAGTLQTLDASLYRVDTARQPGRITPAYGQSWPSVRDVTGTITVAFTAGYGDDATDVPGPIRQAMLLLIGTADCNREMLVIGTIATELQKNYDWLLAPYRLYHL
ncbi:MAG: phage head-tail connector protein [Arhodomonas sp.]|nr:phage head-tail connector protein [Arhodomonas sp.]